MLLRTDRAATGGQGWTIYRKNLGNTTRTSFWDSKTIPSTLGTISFNPPTAVSTQVSLLKPFWFGDMNTISISVSHAGTGEKKEMVASEAENWGRGGYLKDWENSKCQGM